MCKQEVVQSLLLKQVPNHLVQVKNQSKLAVQEVVDLQLYRLDTIKKVNLFEIHFFYAHYKGNL